jgi:5-methylcytosine-specific restriction endonuclease McrA
VTIDEETQRKVERARDLLRHEIPDGDLAAIIDRALTLLVSKVERTKFGATPQPRTRQAAPVTTRSRRIPAAVRRAVWARDQGRCSFIGHDGRCGETGLLEFHHVIPFAASGPSTVENLELRCRPHNALEAERAGLTHCHGQATRSGPS